MAPRQAPGPGLPDGRAYGIRLALSEVKGINEAEVDRIVAARPYHSLSDFWHRARVSRPVVERLVLAGGFDSIYGIGSPLAGTGVRRRGQVTRRDLLLQVADLDRHSRAVDRASRGRGLGRSRGVGATPGAAGGTGSTVSAATRAGDAATRNSSDPRTRELARQEQDAGTTHTGKDAGPGRRDGDVREGGRREAAAREGVWGQASRQSRATKPAPPVTSVQLALDLGDAPGDGESAGLPEMTASDRVRAELEILGLDASRHVMDFYAGFLDALGVTRAADLPRCRSRSEVLVAGVKVATQTPPIRSGRRVVFLTLDDGSGPADATFFEDVQGPYAATVFHSWLLVVRGVLRRTGRHGISLRATGAWELPVLHELWRHGDAGAGPGPVHGMGHGTGPDGALGGLAAVRAFMDQVPEGFAGTEEAVRGAAESRATRPVMAPIPLVSGSPLSDEETLGTGGHDTGHGSTAGGMGRRRVLVHSSGFRMSPYADIKPAGEDAKNLPRSQTKSPQPGRSTSAPRKLWHSSPGSSGG